MEICGGICAKKPDCCHASWPSLEKVETYQVYDRIGRKETETWWMDRAHLYNGSLTAEQFLFYEIRIAAKYYIDGKTIEEAIEIIKKDNLFFNTPQSVRFHGWRGLAISGWMRWATSSSYMSLHSQPAK